MISALTDALSRDCLYTVCAHYLTTPDIAALSVTCKELHAALAPSQAAQQIAVLRFTPAFWARASKRPKKTHLSTWQGELRRIESFEQALMRRNCRTWTERDYIAFWNASDGVHTD